MQVAHTGMEVNDHKLNDALLFRVVELKFAFMRFR